MVIFWNNQKQINHIHTHTHTKISTYTGSESHSLFCFISMIWTHPHQFTHANVQLRKHKLKAWLSVKLELKETLQVKNGDTEQQSVEIQGENLITLCKENAICTICLISECIMLSLAVQRFKETAIKNAPIDIKWIEYQWLFSLLII